MLTILLNQYGPVTTVIPPGVSETYDDGDSDTYTYRNTVNEKKNAVRDRLGKFKKEDNEITEIVTVVAKWLEVRYK